MRLDRSCAAPLLALPLLAGACSPDIPTIEPGIVEPPASAALPVLGLGAVTERGTSELWVHGEWAYTGTVSKGATVGNVVKVWNVAGDAPVLVDSLLVPGPPPGGAPALAPRFHGEHGEDGHDHGAAGPSRISDLQASDDGRLLVVVTEGGPGSIVIYDLASPGHPALVTRYATAATAPGVHTCEVARVNGRLYAFLSVNPSGSAAARLVIVDLGDPRAPRQVWQAALGDPFQHDVFVRDGILFTAMWDDGVGIWDIGGGGAGGSVSAPVLMSTLETVDGNVHNLYWFHDPQTGSRRWLFVGEETGIGGGQYLGDVHVVDVADLTRPREVAFFHVEGAGAHNFAADEQRGVFYSAFYNAGVRALDVRGDLAGCTAGERAPDGRCDLGRMGRELAHGLGDRNVFVWGVHRVGGALYASDMNNGLWKLDVSGVR
jgi:hypothetical protein